METKFATKPSKTSKARDLSSEKANETSTSTQDLSPYSKASQLEFASSVLTENSEPPIDPDLLFQLKHASSQDLDTLYSLKKQMNQALLQAAFDNNEEAIVFLLNKDRHGKLAAQAEWWGEEGLTALHIAASSGNQEACEALIRGGLTNLDLQDRNGSCALHFAAKSGHLEVAKLLVRFGADINLQDDSGNTPLHIAFLSRHRKFAEWLLRKEPNLELLNARGKSPLDIVSKGFVRMREVQDKEIEDLFQPSKVGNETVEKIGVFEETRSASPLDFSVMKQLGKGSFGEVYLVKHNPSGKMYAMKILKKNMILTQNLVRYALTERNVMSYLNHPFIVSLKYAFQTTKHLYMVVKYCSGGDLGTWLQRAKRFSEDRARFYVAEILLALEELHLNNIVYRDLKPDNVVIDSEGHALLTDFGLSKENVADNASTKSFCGSVAYLAPEVLKKAGHGKSVDWYLLGVLLYELLVGIPPYFSNSQDEIFANILGGKLLMPKSLSPEAKDLIVQLMQREPHKRLGSQRDAEEVKNHPFFSEVDWGALYRKDVIPPEAIQVPSSPSGYNTRKVLGNDFECHEDAYVRGWTFIGD